MWDVVSLKYKFRERGWELNELFGCLQLSFFLINRSKIHRLQICLFVRLINTYPRKHYVGKIKVGTMSDWSNSPNWIRICMGQAGASALECSIPRNTFDTVQILEEAVFLTVTKGNRTSKSIKLYESQLHHTVIQKGVVIYVVIAVVLVYFAAALLSELWVCVVTNLFLFFSNRWWKSMRKTSLGQVDQDVAKWALEAVMAGETICWQHILLEFQGWPSPEVWWKNWWPVSERTWW